jgi:DHA3 family macrolide efflux protein-like MFS transporter
MISTLCGFLPQLLISLFAGVWADKYNKKKLIIYSDTLIFISTLILAILFLIGYNELWLLFVVSGIRSLGAGIQMPAVNAVIPEIVPQEKLLRINSINGSIQSIIYLVSPAISGAILSYLTLETTFFIDVITAIIGILIMFSVNIPFIKRDNAEDNHIEDLKEGIRYLRTNKPLKVFLIFYSIFSFLIVPAAILTPLLVTRTFGDEVWKLTVNEMAFFGGSVIGGIILSIFGKNKNKFKLIIFSCYAFGILFALLGVANIFWIYLIIMFITGIFLPFYNASSISFVQEETKPELMGRIFGLVHIIGTSVMPLGMLFFGPISDIVKIEILLVITGIGIIIMSYALQKQHVLLNKK